MQEQEVRKIVLQYIIDWHDKWGRLFDTSSLWIYWNQHYNPGMERGENIADDIMFVISATLLDLVSKGILVPKLGYQGFSTREFQINHYDLLVKCKQSMENG